ncbi:GNAT family N-acetyltransferase [Tistrella mobilis]
MTAGRVIFSWFGMDRPPSGPDHPQPPRPQPPHPQPADLHLTQADGDVETYLAAYRAVGGPHGWSRRLTLTRNALQAILDRPGRRVLIARDAAGTVLGFVELDLAHGTPAAPAAEIVHFGLAPAAQGCGWGGFLLDHALRTAFDAGAARVVLHTDTTDHPRAFGAYLKAGFRLLRVTTAEPDDWN